MASDAERFERIYRENFRAVLRYLLSRLDVDSATDAVAETFLVAWRRLDAVPNDAALPWLLGVARKVAAGQRRSAARQDALWLRLTQAHGRSLAGFEAGLVDQQEIFKALATLREPDREVLLLVAWDELTSAEAAAVVGVSRVAFAVRLHRARRRFAAALESAAETPRPTSDRSPVSPAASQQPAP